MAEPHAYSQPIQTYGPAPHNRNIWPHNSRATVFCLRFWPILLFALVAPLYPLLLSVPFCPFHFVRDILSVTFCPLPFCPKTIHVGHYRTMVSYSLPRQVT